MPSKKSAKKGKKSAEKVRKAPERIRRFVALNLPADPMPLDREKRLDWLLGIELDFFLDKDRKKPAPHGGRIEVPQSPGGPGATIFFDRAAGESWSFNELEIHPGGKDESPVDLNWILLDDVVALRDVTGTARMFHYTLSVIYLGTTIYFDPELVNIGDSGPASK